MYILKYYKDSKYFNFRKVYYKEFEDDLSLHEFLLTLTKKERESSVVFVNCCYVKKS